MILTATLPFVIAALLADSALAAEPKPSFQKLKSASSTVFVCHFDFQSVRTKEKFAGQMKLTSIGEVILVIKLNAEPANECAYALRELDLGDETEDGGFHLNALRTKACQPLLTHDMRKRLDESLDLNLPVAEQSSKVKQPTAKLAVIYIEGKQPCSVTTLAKRELRSLQNRLATTGAGFRRPPVLPEPLDTSDAQSALKQTQPHP